MANAFSLHPHLAADTEPVAELALSRVLLMNDARVPWLILAPVGCLWVLRDGRIARAWRALLVLTVLGVPLLMSGFVDWHGGQTLGPRYLVFLMPLFGIGAALAVDRLARGAFPPGRLRLLLPLRLLRRRRRLPPRPLQQPHRSGSTRVAHSRWRSN